MELYTFFRSSTSFRLRIALAYKGIAYEPRFVSLPKMEHQAPAYLAKNPQGLVPALVDDAGHFFSCWCSSSSHSSRNSSARR